MSFSLDHSIFSPAEAGKCNKGATKHTDLARLNSPCAKGWIVDSAKWGRTHPLPIHFVKSGNHATIERNQNLLCSGMSFRILAYSFRAIGREHIVRYNLVPLPLILSEVTTSIFSLLQIHRHIQFRVSRFLTEIR